MASNLVWRGEEAKRAVAKEFTKRLERCAILLKNEIKQAISLPSGKGKTPSSPGGYPHKDTGRLRASISHEITEGGKNARVGTNVEYGLYLERGTRHLAARPYMRPTFEKLKPRIMAILKGS